MNKLQKTLENVWLIMAILSAIFAGYKLVTLGWDAAYHFLLFPFVCGLWYGLRRFMRLRMERIMEEHEQQNGNS